MVEQEDEGPDVQREVSGLPGEEGWGGDGICIGSWAERGKRVV